MNPFCSSFTYTAALTVLSLFIPTSSVFAFDPLEGNPYGEVPKENAGWCALEKLPFGEVFDLPVGFIHLPDGSTIIACQRGMFYRVDLKAPETPATVFLDFRERMKGVAAFEDGVHGLALHPQFEMNGRFFLSYSQNDPRRTVISEMKVDLENDYRLEPETERIIFTLQQPLADHWGGQILFGPDDGLLYIGLGDGGLRDDPYRMAQNPWALHGKILRIDIDRKQGGLAYGIPPDNPFVGLQLMREEIYATGIRNPWGLSFDPETGHLWCADVGQDFWEEINRIEKGGNYGWSDRDGPAAFYKPRELLLEDAEMIDPVFAYTRMRGDGICIIGGMSYRGERFPELEGAYVYAEWGLGIVEAIELSDDEKRATRRWTLHLKPADGGPFNPTFVGADLDGEILVLSQDGTVWELKRTSGKISKVGP